MNRRRGRYLGLLGLTLGCVTPPPSPSGSEAPALIPRKTLFSASARKRVRLSPDGRYLSWLAPYRGVQNVWIAPFTDVSKARAVTENTKQGVWQYRWAFDGRHLLSLEDRDGDENRQLIAVDIETKEARALTPDDGSRVDIRGMSSRHPDDIVVDMNGPNETQVDLFRIHLPTGKMTKILHNDRDYVYWYLDADLRVRVASRSTPEGGTELFKDAGNGLEPWRTYGLEDSFYADVLGFGKDGRIAYLRTTDDRDTAGLFQVDLETDEASLVFGDERADVSRLYLHPQTHEKQAVQLSYLRDEWMFFDPRFEADFRKLREGLGMDIGIVGRSRDDLRWLVLAEASDSPPAYFAFDRTQGTWTPLFQSNPAVAEFPLARMYGVEIPSRDGLTLPSLITLPSEVDDGGKARRPVPLIVRVHGGPWARDYWGYYPERQWLANRGYAVLSINFRGSDGFGKKFLNAGNGEWAGKMQNDLLDGVAWAIENGFADPKRVAIMGTSYGGYATLVGLAQTPDTFACGVDIVGISNLITFMENVPAWWMPAMELFYKRVGDPRVPEGRADLEARSPLNHADGINKPLLVVQGANDPRVHQFESDRIVAAVKKRNVPVVYALFPDEGHGIRKNENKHAVYAVMEAFFGRCLKGRVEPFQNALRDSTIQILEGEQEVLPAASGSVSRK